MKYPVHRMYIVKLSKQCHLELEIKMTIWQQIC